MKEEIRRKITESLMSACGMTQEEAAEKVYDLDELDGGFNSEFKREVLGVEEIEFDVLDLSASGHSYNMNVCISQDEPLILLQFNEGPNLTAVEDAFREYEASPASEELVIENEIEDESDGLVLSYEGDGELQEALMRIFELLKSEECRRLIDSVLMTEK